MASLSRNITLHVLSDIDGVLANFVQGWLVYIYQHYGVCIAPQEIAEYRGMAKLLYDRILEQRPSALRLLRVDSLEAFLATKPPALCFENNFVLYESIVPTLELLPVYRHLNLSAWVNLQFVTSRSPMTKDVTEKWLDTWGLQYRAPTIYARSNKEKAEHVLDVAKRTRAPVIYLEDHPDFPKVLHELEPQQRRNLSLYMPAATYNAQFEDPGNLTTRFPLRPLAAQLRRTMMSTKPAPEPAPRPTPAHAPSHAPAPAASQTPKIDPEGLTSRQVPPSGLCPSPTRGR